MSGRVRPLVPFFVSHSDGTLSVNDTLRASTPPPSGALVQLTVRSWDHENGVFTDATHVVRDLPQPKERRLLTPAEIRRKKAQIPSSSMPELPVPPRRPRVQHDKTDRSPERRTERRSPERRGMERKMERRSPERRSLERKVVNVERKMERGAQGRIEGAGMGAVKEKAVEKVSDTVGEKTPSKMRPFAGSTFEAASPAPHGLPIPSFVRRVEETPSEDVVDVEPDVREQAAIELRRLLRI